MKTGSRPWIKKRVPVRKPSLAFVTLRTTWVIQVESDSDVIPGNLDAPRREVDDDEHGKPREPPAGPDVDGEEVCGGEDQSMAGQNHSWGLCVT